METYHKIQTVFKRDPENKNKTLIEGDYSLPEFEYLKDNEWVFTEKVDGTNIRIIFDGTTISYKGKTDDAQMPVTLRDKLESIFNPKLPTFEVLFPTNEGEVANICLYGEGYGPKIQKGGGNYGTEQDFVLFDVRVDDWWLRRSDVEVIAINLGLRVVPIIGTGTLQDMIDRCREGFNSTWGDFRAEGIIAKPATELKARNGERIITKLKCKDFYRHS